MYSGSVSVLGGSCEEERDDDASCEGQRDVGVSVHEPRTRTAVLTMLTVDSLARESSAIPVSASNTDIPSILEAPDQPVTLTLAPHQLTPDIVRMI